MRRTKIVCTLGPASSGRERIGEMLHAGMDVARLNTSHGTLAEHLERLQDVRELAAAEGRTVAVLLDLGGTKLRARPSDGGPTLLLEEDAGILIEREPSGDANAITVAYPRLTEDVLPGAPVSLDDGVLELQVVEVTERGLRTVVVHGGELHANKGVSFPGSNLAMPPLTERDREAIAVGVEAGVDYFGLSFVRTAADVRTAREAIAERGATTPVIAKIERRQAIDNLDEILAEADVVMVARGDLGVELAAEEVPGHQRRIVEGAAANLVPVIIATQMLESMTASPRPTRAEVSDVANAVWDLVDAVMLSGETAIGKYPVQSVAMMDRIIREAERTGPRSAPPAVRPKKGSEDSHALAAAARSIAETSNARRAIVSFTRTGYTAALLSKAHPEGPIFAITPSEEVSRQLALLRSVVPMLAPLPASSDEMFHLVDRVLLESGQVSEGDAVVLVTSLPVEDAVTSNFLKLHRVGTGGPT